ncbi:MAG TPA: hypothetical protein VH650_11480 [Gaiellaceae bacterium]|jgi:hypothetical protein
MTLLSRFRRTPAEPWPADRPVRFITSFNGLFYEASGRRCAKTFREHNPSYELWAYVESIDDQAETELEGLGVRVVHLEELPLLGEFLELARDVIPQEFGGDAPPEMFPGEGPQTGDIWFRKNMYRWFRKIVALDHTAGDYDDVLFWLDCDCFAKQPLPQSVIEGAFDGAGVIRMKANRKHTETGLVGYDLGRPGVRELIAAMRDHYMSREFERYKRWDDCITLDLCLKRPDAPSARDIAKRAVANAEVLPTTPFAPYLEHEKGLHSRRLGLVL